MNFFSKNVHRLEYSTQKSGKRITRRFLAHFGTLIIVISQADSSFPFYVRAQSGRSVLKLSQGFCALKFLIKSLYPYRTPKRASQTYDEASENLYVRYAADSKAFQTSFDTSAPARRVRVHHKQRSFRLTISYTLLIVKAVAWVKE